MNLFGLFKSKPKPRSLDIADLILKSELNQEIKEEPEFKSISFEIDYFRIYQSEQKSYLMAYLESYIRLIDPAIRPYEIEIINNGKGFHEFFTFEFKNGRTFWLFELKYRPTKLRSDYFPKTFEIGELVMAKHCRSNDYQRGYIKDLSGNEILIDVDNDNPGDWWWTDRKYVSKIQDHERNRDLETLTQKG